jgi:eukaryotic-like serine/threonine-protein kinase
MRERAHLPFQFGPWLVNPAESSLSRRGETRRLEPLAMDVLEALCLRAGEVVTTETLLADCWGSSLQGDNPVHKVITQLRKALGDDSTAPTFIATIRKRGYQTLATVKFADGYTNIQPGSWRAGSPFRGLESFDERHAAIFQGRREAVALLKQAVLSQASAGYSLQVILGPSGSGKTSLIRAGLIPALTESADGCAEDFVGAVTWDIGDVKELDLFSSLASSLIDWEIDGRPVFENVAAADLGASIAEDAKRLSDDLDRAFGDKPGRLILFIDRFEALFTLPQLNDEDRVRLMALLARVAECPRTALLIACRNDFYPQVAAQPVLMAAKKHGGHFDLQPPTAAELAQMIRLPAAAAGLRFGTDPASGEKLDDALCLSAARSPDALPLLQYTLQELYRRCTAAAAIGGEAQELSYSAYQSLGGLEGALGHRAEEVVNGLGPAERAALERVLSLVVTVSIHDETVTSRGAAWSDLNTEAERRLVGALVEARLFVSHFKKNDSGFGVAHEALLRRWPRVLEWIDAHRQALRIRARVTLQTLRWVEEGRSADLLLPSGKPLEEATALLQMGTLSLSSDEKALIDESARKTKRGQTLRRSAVAMICLLAVLSTGLGISAMTARRAAEQKRVEAEGLMGYMLNDFADKMRSLGRLDLLDAISNKALGYLADKGGETEGPTAQMQRAKAMQVIGEVRVQSGDSKGAQQALQAAHEVFERLLKDKPASTDLLKDKGVNAYWLGRIHRDRREFVEAERYYREYLRTADKLHELEPENTEWWIEQSYGHNNLGGLARLKGDYEQAKRELERSLALKTRALEKRPDDRRLRDDYADTLSWLGSVESETGNLASAQDYYHRGIAVVEKTLTAFPADTRLKARGAYLDHALAKVRLARGETDVAMRGLRRVVDAYTELVGYDPQNIGWHGELIAARLQSTVLQESPKERGRSAALSQILQAAETLAGRDPSNAVWIEQRAAIQRRIALALLAEGDTAQARNQTQGAANVLSAIPAKSVTGRIRLEHAMVLLARADVARAAKDNDEAHKACQEARALLANDAKASRSYAINDAWVRIHLCLGLRDEAAPAIDYLAAIGYRQVEYRRILTQYSL